MSKGLQIIGFTPNGKYMLTKDMYFDHERWYLWTRKISATTAHQERSEVEGTLHFPSHEKFHEKDLIPVLQLMLISMMKPLGLGSTCGGRTLMERSSV